MECMDADIFTKASKYILLIKHIGSAVGLTESEKDEEWVEGNDVAGKNTA